MADTQSVISDVKLFLERLKKELPEVFGPSAAPAKEGEQAPAIGGNQILFNGKLCAARLYETPDQEEGADKAPAQPLLQRADEIIAEAQALEQQVLEAVNQHIA